MLSAFLFTGSNVPDEDVQIKINIFNTLKINQLILSHNRGVYNVIGDGRSRVKIEKGDYAYITLTGSSFGITVNGKSIGNFREVFFEGEDYANSLKIKSVRPKSEIRIYEDNIRIRFKKNKFQIVNEPELNHYIAGVVESEVGKRAHLEYYKLQSILCRTYALSNLRKHEAEGFNVCDEVHCQVYKGKSVSNRNILKATAATTGLVVIDNSLDLITATFHSNCGGHTVNSEDVWSLPLEYLRGVRDTFCHEQPHAIWNKTIALKDWEGYLKRKFNFPLHNDEMKTWVTHYEQKERDVFYSPHNVPLKVIRKDWGLNSTYFSISHKNDSVYFEGKGFGHGVGLCQEGAMNMAQHGYSYKSILNHYYKSVNLVNLRALRFVTEE